MRSAVTGSTADKRTAINLMNFGHIHSGYHQPWALGSGMADPYTKSHLVQTRPWAVSGDAFGLKAWTTTDHAYQLYYSDDDARGLLGAIATVCWCGVRACGVRMCAWACACAWAELLCCCVVM